MSYNYPRAPTPDAARAIHSQRGLVILQLVERTLLRGALIGAALEIGGERRLARGDRAAHLPHGVYTLHALAIT